MSSSLDLPFYECQFCGKKIIKKKTFDSHECEKMKRHKLCKTKRGLNAFIDYKHWLSLKGRTISKLETFVDSKFFNAFVQFQEFVSIKGIPDKKMYMALMTELWLSPMLWRTDALYERYIATYDETKTPIQMVTITLRTLQRLSELLECDINGVFEYLLPSEVARLIYERRLSPWLLLLSPTFTHYLHMLKDPEQFILISNLIDSDVWNQKFKKNKEDVKRIKEIIKELDL